MRVNTKVFCVSVLSILVLLVIFGQSYDKEKEKAKEIAVTSWLLLGPTATPLPAFHKEKPESFGIDNLLKFEDIDMTWLKPEKGQTVSGPDGSSWVWKSIQTEDGGIKLPASPGHPSTAYLCAYLDVKRWSSATPPTSSWRPVSTA